MELNLLKDNVQRSAVDNWISSKKKGTIEVATGVGKTFIALHCLHSMPKNDGIHLFLAETTERESDLNRDILKYDKIFGTTTRRDYNLVFRCYQGVYKKKGLKAGLVICDEIHNSLSEKYSQFYFNNDFDAIVGLSATVDRESPFLLDGILTTKGQLLDEIAPVCFKYTLSQAKEDGVSRKLNIYVIQQDLDEKTKNIPAGSASKKFFQTEKQAYDYWELQHKRSWFIENREEKSLKIRITASKRSALLFGLPSKINAVSEILKFTKGKSIVFGNNLDSLLKITPDVVSSRNSAKDNKTIRDNFDNGWINVIGSFKKLRQGANLKDLDNAIIMSYYSSEVHIIQMLGRLRQNGNKDGSIFILLTKNTQEEVWFNKMFENFINDFNMIYCENITEAYKIYKKHEQ